MQVNFKYNKVCGWVGGKCVLELMEYDKLESNHQIEAFEVVRLSDIA